MSPTATPSLKHSSSSTPLLGTSSRTPSPVAKKDPPNQPDLATGEPQIEQELERWENIVFSFGMEGKNGQSNDGDYPGRRRSQPSTHLHQHPEQQVHPTAGGVPGLATPWDHIPPFIPTPPYDQHLPYDMLGLGAVNAIPPTHPHSIPHSTPDLFGSPWDLSLQGMQSLRAPPLTPAEIAQYHVLLARGAASFPLPPSGIVVPQPISSPEGSSPTSPVLQAASTRSRSTSNAGRSSSQSRSAIPEEEVVAIAEDKRHRNTAASARFRVKKKQRTMELERAVVELEGRADNLEKEAVGLRRENGWLKDMVILKGRKATESAQAATKSNTNGGPSDSGDQAKSKGIVQNSEGGDSIDKGKGKSKE